MKSIAILAALLLLFAFFAGCTQPAGDVEPNQDDTTMTEQEQNQELDDFENSLIAEDNEVEIGDVI